MPATDLTSILASVHDKTQNTVTISDNWQQGRATYGGLIAAICVRQAMLARIDTDLPLRSILVSFVAPVSAGEAALRAESLRVGKSVEQYAVTLMQNDRVAATVTAAFGRARDAAGITPRSSIDAPLPSALTPSPYIPGMPAFLQNVEIFWIGDGIPMSNTKDTRSRLWAGFREDMAGFETERIIALADMPPPIMMAHYDRMIAGSSLQWMLDFVVPPASVAEQHIFFDMTADAAADGYLQQSGKIFSSDGALIAITHQSMTYFP